MKPQGRRPHNFPGKIDHHFIKIKNWWEGICTQNKALEKRTLDKEVKQELQDMDNYDDS